ncbi:hypothetical protein I5462_19070 [Citrobacter freundii]|uniref:hypothetical protein n=1 Tax=Citrobacter freundii TaxID=546 RepID=UPI00157569D9|nr:hypothetical protein [Citrobacter freundii]EMB4340266.1 hypothetical protein [Citrobacter freundii]MBJ9043163.1 hypothetical protein [Citrobacter freundii]NTY74992.1 hypothetical protein [Citrobacter freundii]NUA11439.1 hypothetical protein [Citrobacter freundii]HAT7546452.1 hypothetical protein [Citrobacter freundii]
MGSNIIELAKLGHERAAELKASCGAVDVRSLAQLISDLATQLEVQLVRGNALAAENAGLKAAFDKPQAYLSWHAIPPTWEDPLPCGEYLDVHDEAGHKNSDGTDCWPVYAKPEIKTPATDAFLAEVRAQGVDVARNALVKFVEDEVGPNTNVPGLIRGAEVCVSIAAQLRKGGEA